MYSQRPFPFILKDLPWLDYRKIEANKKTIEKKLQVIEEHKQKALQQKNTTIEKYGVILRVSDEFMMKYNNAEYIWIKNIYLGNVSKNFLNHITTKIYECYKIDAMDIKITCPLPHPKLFLLSEGMEYPVVYINSNTTKEDIKNYQIL